MTLDDIKARCHEDGDCLVWSGRTNAKGYPKHGQTLLRRRVLEFTAGELKRSELASVTCGNPSCLNPDHIRKASKSTVALEVNKRADVQAKRTASNRRTARSRLAKLSIEKAREIRASSEPGKVLAERYGVSDDLISKVRHDKAWVETTPFSGLFAANDAKRRAA